MEKAKAKDAWFFVFGALAGATVTVLSSPYRGHEMRQKLKETVRKAKAKGNDISEEIAV